MTAVLCAPKPNFPHSLHTHNETDARLHTSWNRRTHPIGWYVFPQQKLHHLTIYGYFFPPNVFIPQSSSLHVHPPYTLLSIPIICSHASFVSSTISVWNTLPHVALIVTNITTFRSTLHPLLAVMCTYPTLCFICIFSHGVNTLITCIPGSYYGYVPFAFLHK